MVPTALGMSWQLSCTSLHVAVLHWSPASPQSFWVVPGVHAPPWHWSPRVQNAPSSHSVPFGEGTMLHTGGSCPVSQMPRLHTGIPGMAAQSSLHGDSAPLPAVPP